jgi:hypothetical protein
MPMRRAEALRWSYSVDAKRVPSSPIFSDSMIYSSSDSVYYTLGAQYRCVEAAAT